MGRGSVALIIGQTIGIGLIIAANQLIGIDSRQANIICNCACVKLHVFSRIIIIYFLFSTSFMFSLMAKRSSIWSYFTVKDDEHYMVYIIG